MEDEDIIELYFDRSETAISATQSKYGKYCYCIAYNILYSDLDAEECVNDTYMKVWNCVPPSHPTNFKAFIGRITRNLALNKYEYNNAQKRSPKLQAAVEELSLCGQDKDLSADEDELKEIINSFLTAIPQKHRIIFMQRYWYFCSVADIAISIGLTKNHVKVILHRTTKKFKDYLVKKGVIK